MPGIVTTYMHTGANT